MQLMSDGIDRVRANVIGGGITGDGSNVGESLNVIISWRSLHADKLYQVYINGSLCGFTDDVLQRRMLSGYRSCRQSVIRIEVFAVEAGDAATDFSDELEPYDGGGRVKLSFARRISLPYSGSFFVYGNDGAGPIDYNAPLSEGVPLWGACQDKAGFGLCRFGESDFGWDGSAAIGFGRGAFGKGEFGFDADVVEWTSGELSAGEYSFAIKAADSMGNLESGVSLVSDVVVIPAADAAEVLEVDSFDSDANSLLLKIG